MEAMPKLVAGTTESSYVWDYILICISSTFHSQSAVHRCACFRNNNQMKFLGDINSSQLVLGQGSVLALLPNLFVVK